MNAVTAIVKLSALYYLRTYRFWAPALAAGLFIVFVYTVVPNPIMESYAMSSALLFAIAAWAGYGFVDAEHPAHGALAALHGGGYRRYWAGRLTAGLLVLVPAPAAAMTLYPMLLGKFERAAQPAEAAAAFAGHLALGALGFAVAVWFSRRLFAKPYTAMTCLFLAVAAALSAEGAAQELPSGIDLAVWLLPPVRLTVAYLNGFEQAGAADALLGIGMPMLYACLLLASFTVYMSHRRP